MSNLDAFLSMIAASEGTSTHRLTKNRGYDVIVTGIDGPEVFTDYSDHPFAHRQPKLINKAGLASSASGRYQLLYRFWLSYKKLLKLADFSADSQDAVAIQQIKERGALPDIDAGHFQIAVGKCSNLWASLPGAGYGQRENQMAALEDAYERAGGTFA